jgi:hypothetical protein
MVNYLSFPWLFFCLKIHFNVYGKVLMWHTPCYKSKFVKTWILLSVKIFETFAAFALALLQVFLNEIGKVKLGLKKQCYFISFIAHEQKGLRCQKLKKKSDLLYVHFKIWKRHKTNGQNMVSFIPYLTCGKLQLRFLPLACSLFFIFSNGFGGKTLDAIIYFLF